MTARGGKVMKDNYKELWDRIIRELGKEDGFDFAVIETVTSLATALSMCKLRDVRRVAVVTAAQVSQSMLYVGGREAPSAGGSPGAGGERKERHKQAQKGRSRADIGHRRCLHGTGRGVHSRNSRDLELCPLYLSERVYDSVQGRGRGDSGDGL